MSKVTHYANQRERRRARVRGKVHGTSSRPRLNVFRSNRHIYAQVVDDSQGRTLAFFSSRKLTDKARSRSKIEQATLVGEQLAKKLKDLGVKKVVFDRAGYLYHGRVKGVAEGARNGGLKF